MRARFGMILVASVWVLSIAGGAGYLAAHASRPGEAAQTPIAWPESLGVPRDAGRWTVVLAAHPRCPCTRATADELIAAFAGTGDRADLIVLAYEPEDSSFEHFADTGVIQRLGSLPHSTVVADPGGRIAAAFGALTSGHAAVYSPGGDLCFSGGLTPTRAHIGPNTGSASVRSLLLGEEPLAATAPVYGCPLDNGLDAAGLIDLGGCTTSGVHACTP